VGKTSPHEAAEIHPIHLIRTRSSSHTAVTATAREESHAVKRQADLRHDLHALFQAALQAVDSGKAMRTHARRQDHQLHMTDRTYDLRQRSH
jgi:hypothetical protein